MASTTSSGQQELNWFPMRVTYNRELKVKESLDRLSIENFLPLKNKIVERNGHRHYEIVPAIHNLLFVHSSREQLTNLKMTSEEFSPMRYMMTHPLTPEARPQIIRVPDHEMENFMRVAKIDDERVQFLDYASVAHKVGRRVIIVDGDFTGIEGVIKRINHNRHVVVQLEGIIAAVLAFVPPAHLKFLE
ncbi:MAG: UpxY family transcription antiterminator [Bacteroidaceae bacterium]|nr:UpxY family transcription antiterminator [Bacteroidaceae bacterium]